MEIPWRPTRRWEAIAKVVILVIVVGIFGFLIGSVSTSLNQQAGTGHTVTTTITVTKPTTIYAMTTSTATTLSTVTKTVTYTSRTTVTRPPELVEIPQGEWLTEDERVKVETKLLVLEGRYYYIKVKVTNVSNETLERVAVLFVPYVGGKPIWNPSFNTKLFTYIEPGETYVHQFRIPSPDTDYKVYVFVL